MGDLKLFRREPGGLREIKSETLDLERSLQTLLEANLESALGVRFLASEHSTGRTHGGRIDTLGLDENGCPVIIEYKRSLNENVINQGLYYLDWLMDHRAEFQLLVLKRLGAAASDEIDWSGPRLLCIAGDFTKYDVHAVQQINRNVELIRHRRFGSELLALELVNAVSSEISKPARHESFSNHQGTAGAAVQNRNVVDLWEALRAFLGALGDDVQEKQLKLYTAFKRIKNFACVVVHNDRLSITARVDPGTVTLEPPFTRDVRDVGHWGTGDLEIVIRTLTDLERSKPLLPRAYEES